MEVKSFFIGLIMDTIILVAYFRNTISSQRQWPGLCHGSGKSNPTLDKL